MKGLLAVTFVVFCFNTGLSQDKSHDEALDGLVVVGEFSDGESVVMDTLSFTGCEMASQRSSLKGFAKACYFVESMEGGVRFKVTMENKKEGKMQWKGSIRDGKVDAVIVMTDEQSGSSTEYEFVGAKHAPKKAE